MALLQPILVVVFMALAVYMLFKRLGQRFWKKEASCDNDCSCH